MQSLVVSFPIRKQNTLYIESKLSSCWLWLTGLNVGKMPTKSFYATGIESAAANLD